MYIKSIFIWLIIASITTAYLIGYISGHQDGQLYAYDNIVVCGASPEDEGLRVAAMLGLESEVSNIKCKGGE